MVVLLVYALESIFVLLASDIEFIYSVTFE